MSDQNDKGSGNRRRRRGGRGVRTTDDGSAGNGQPPASAKGGSKPRGGSKGGAKSGGKKGGPRKRPEIPGTFWGDVDAVPDTAGSVRITHAPAAVVQSLGRPPLPGHEVPAEHTFKLVYEYSVNLASALAAAGELIEPEELQENG